MKLLNIKILSGVTLLALVLASPADAARKRKQSAGAGSDADAKLRPLVELHLDIAASLAKGLFAYDAQNWVVAADELEEVLAIKGLPADVAEAVRPFAEEARKKAGPKIAGAPHPDAAPDVAPTDKPEEPAEPEKPKPPPTMTVQGSVTGGGPGGPGGAVVTLYRADGKTPRPAPLLNKPLIQKDKQFVPHVLVVPVGTKVSFRNQDPIFHNVFSISPVKAFDTGLKKAGDSETVVFDKPGVIELLCNIHASMSAWLVVVDTPWFGVADGAGAFRIKNVPPGEYDAQVWHENASQPTRTRVTVSPDRETISLAVGGDRRANPFPPDKYGKPRQSQLGY